MTRLLFSLYVLYVVPLQPQTGVYLSIMMFWTSYQSIYQRRQNPESRPLWLLIGTYDIDLFHIGRSRLVYFEITIIYILYTIEDDLSGWTPCWYFVCFGWCITKQKIIKYRGMFEIQKSGDKTSSGEIGLDIRRHASPKVGQDQVSGWVSVLCWHAAPVAYVLWKPCKKSNSVIRSRSVKVKNWCNVLSMEGVTVCGHHLECRVTFGRRGPHIVW